MMTSLSDNKAHARMDLLLPWETAASSPRMGFAENDQAHKGF